MVLSMTVMTPQINIEKIDQNYQRLLTYQRLLVSTFSLTCPAARDLDDADQEPYFHRPYQYCLLGPRMICPIPMIMIISIACSDRE